MVFIAESQRTVGDLDKLIECKSKQENIKLVIQVRVFLKRRESIVRQRCIINLKRPFWFDCDSNSIRFMSPLHQKKIQRGGRVISGSSSSPSFEALKRIP